MLLLRKIGLSEHEIYINYILLKQPQDCSFVETVETLNKIFGEHPSLFNARFNCLNITKCNTEDFTTWDSSTSNVNGLKFPPSQMNSLSV